MPSNSYFDILPMSNSLVTSKVFNLEVYYQICCPYVSKDYSSRTSETFILDFSDFRPPS